MSLSQRQHEYLQLLGIDVWVARDALTVVDEVAIPSGADTAAGPAGQGDTEWSLLRGQVSACMKCQLHKGRTQTVFGTGHQTADWMVIGEAPGAEEDRQGEPFVGRAGKLLTSMLFAIGLQRQQVYIANILKCRPPNNRDPAPEEVSACEDYLRRQIALVRPKIILVVGRIAAQNLLKIDTPIGKMRGQAYRYAELDIPVIVTYHPAYLLRSPREKYKAWEDLQTARQLYSEIGA
jgi:uracil-DNA glycosylase family 4